MFIFVIIDSFHAGKFVKTILDYEYTDVNKEGPVSPILTAVRSGDPKMVEILLGHKNIGVNQDSDQMTSLTEVTNILERFNLNFTLKAIFRKNEKIVAQLLKHPHIDVNKINDRGWIHNSMFIIHEEHTCFKTHGINFVLTQSNIAHFKCRHEISKN